MKLLLLFQIVFLLSANAADTSNVRRRMTHEEVQRVLEEEPADPMGLWGNVWSWVTGNGWHLGAHWKEDDHDINDMGAFVFEMSFNGKQFSIDGFVYFFYEHV